jgi:hypothetical protein
MSKYSVIDTGGRQMLVREGESSIKPNLIAEAEATRQLERIAPDWPVHLYDGGIIDHILKVINNPRTSRTEITRRYRARRSVSGLGAPSAFGSVLSYARRRR